ncbi:unnamed protein product, partial [Anisakis simplex]|uniref:DUF3072 domain-containing protein n=1 Tax=Anisakis simplex TaxID=6269 RepID=A0A0M3JJC7_ANISI
MTNPMQNRNLQSQDPNDIDDDEMRIWDDDLEQQQLPQREHPVETIREEAEEDVADASKMSSSRRT